MKSGLRIIVLAVMLTIIFEACSSTKSTQTTTANLNVGAFSGKWTVTDVRVDIPADYKIGDVFDEAPYEDFRGSRWELVRNGKGSFTLNSGASQEIFWSLYNQANEKMFQFKKLEHKDKAKNVDDGYRLQIMQSSDTAFVLRSNLNLGDQKQGYITYNFSKN
ncbi:MAG: hypothetical protein ABIR81_04670 [Ginsengibacter sp.]